ncbi:RNA-binding protein [Halodesulfurarchaeum sp.]|uniref:RNA-binding protein n=1 Tax=Halodesulfurarchaeum sp. TaxID=1980530 RepID=UPI001BBFCE8D|nr:RNA-binding protein [Halodesulfurarchaeum sp.]
MGRPFHYVDLRAFCYATEDGDRVRDALRTVIPEQAAIESAVGEGHHGDRIVILSSRVERAADIGTIFDRLEQAIDVDRIRAELDDRLDENNALYIGLDKQAAARGELAFGDGLTLRAKVEAYPAKREAALENAREALD